MSVGVEAPPVDEGARIRRETRARRKRLARRGAGCFAILAGIAIVMGGGVWLVLFLLERADGYAMVQALAGAKAAGVPLTYEDVAKRAPNDPETVEATRLWRKAISGIDPARFYGEEAQGVPMVDYARTDDGVDPPERGDKGRLTGEDLKRAVEFVAPFQESFRAARVARDAKAPANFAANPGSPADASQGYAYVQQMSLLRTALQLDAEARLAGGDVDGALENLATMAATDAAMRNDMNEWSHRMRHVGLEQTVKLLERMLAVESLDDEQLQRLDEAFAPIDEAAAFRLSLAASRVGFLEWVQMDDARFYEVFRIERAPRSEGADLAKGLSMFAELEAASEDGLVPAVQRGETLTAELQALAGDGSEPNRFIVTSMTVSQFVEQAKFHLKAEAHRALARTGVACERYRLANGRLPAKLDDLVPEYLPAVPVDPCDGQPLRYRQDAAGVRLYSIGADFTDEGGGAAVGSAAAMFQSSDVVFRLKKSKADESESQP